MRPETCRSGWHCIHRSRSQGPVGHPSKGPLPNRPARDDSGARSSPCHMAFLGHADVPSSAFRSTHIAGHGPAVCARSQVECRKSSPLERPQCGGDVPFRLPRCRHRAYHAVGIISTSMAIGRRGAHVTKPPVTTNPKSRNVSPATPSAAHTNSQNTHSNAALFDPRVD